MIARGARLACLGIASLAGAPVRAESAIVHFGATMADGSKVELVARLVTPSANAPFAAVALLHGCDGTDLHSDWVERSFAGWPYAFLDVDSLGPRGVAQACEGYGKVSPTMRARDAHAAREWLAAQRFIDGHRIAVMGWSMGPETALQAISTPTSTSRTAPSPSPPPSPSIPLVP